MISMEGAQEREREPPPYGFVMKEENAGKNSSKLTSQYNKQDEGDSQNGVERFQIKQCKG